MSAISFAWTDPFAYEFSNSFIGINSGTAVTTGNSGGTSGTAFSAVTGTITSNTTADLTTAYDRGMVCSLTAGQNSYAAWNHNDLSDNGYLRVYMRRAATPGVTQRIARGLSGSTIIWELRWQADGTVLLTTGAIGIWFSSVTGVTALNTIYRVEVHFNKTEGEVRVFAGESTTPMAANQWGAVPERLPWTTTRFGLMTTTNQTMSVDVAALKLSNLGWIGPA